MLYGVGFFFFFKQKTAYEMRISDWSSDVCSSDLAGCKPADAWRIGTEHEKFCYGLDDFRPLPYAGERSIRALLEGLQRFGWAAVTEGDNVIALAKNGAGVSLEPGGQFELSGAPLKTIHDTFAGVHTHPDQTREVPAPPALPARGSGFQPN